MLSLTLTNQETLQIPIETSSTSAVIVPDTRVEKITINGTEFPNVRVLPIGLGRGQLAVRYKGKDTMTWAEFSEAWNTINATVGAAFVLPKSIDTGTKTLTEAELLQELVHPFHIALLTSQTENLDLISCNSLKAIFAQKVNDKTPVQVIEIHNDLEEYPGTFRISQPLSAAALETLLGIQPPVLMDKAFLLISKWEYRPLTWADIHNINL